MQHRLSHRWLMCLLASVVIVACSGALRTGTHLGSWTGNAGYVSLRNGRANAVSIPVRLDLDKRDRFRFWMSGRYQQTGRWSVRGDTLAIIFGPDTVRFWAPLSNDGSMMEIRPLRDTDSLQYRYYIGVWKNRF